MNRPKALVELDGVPLVRRALAALADGGCDPLFVVVGAAADEVTALVGDSAFVVPAADWAEGMGASLRAGLAALSGTGASGAALSETGASGTALSGTGASGTRASEPGPDRPAVDATVVHLVDLPGVGAPAIARLAAAGGGPEVLARASYDGVPGHPVLLGRAHWPGVTEAATGDAGARGYLAGHPDLLLVECGDVADPRDVDTPDALRRFADRSR